jgi:hypothetical protein
MGGHVGQLMALPPRESSVNPSLDGLKNARMLRSTSSWFHRQPVVNQCTHFLVSRWKFLSSSPW